MLSAMLQNSSGLLLCLVTALRVSHSLAQSAATTIPPEVKEWAGTQNFTVWELGQYGPAFAELWPGCFLNESQSAPEPPTDFPCTGLQYFFPNCTYGISLQAAISANGPNWLENPLANGQPYTPLTNASQQACYCTSDYWEYVRDCNTCMRDHPYGVDYANFEVFIDADIWLPTEYINEQSSTYCSGLPTMQALDFLAKWTPTSADNNITPLSTTLPATATNVAAYATLTATLSVPTQTTQVGSLGPKPTSSADKRHTGSTVALVGLIWFLCGLKRLL